MTSHQESSASTTFAASSARTSPPRPPRAIGARLRRATCAERGIARRRRRRPRQPAERRVRCATRWCEGLTARGVDVVDIGVVPTPLIYWSLHHLGVVGGIQITGSHNPPEFNGFKLCRRHGVGARRRTSSELYALHRRQPAGPPERGDGAHARQVIDRYVDDIVARIGRSRAPVQGRRTTAATAPARSSRRSSSRARRGRPRPVLRERRHVSQSSPRSDGRRRTSRTSSPRCARTAPSSGIAFDGDADRIGVVDRDGTIIWGDHLLILYARDVLARTGPRAVDHLRREVLAGPARRHRAGGRRAGDVEDRALAHQGEDEGAARAARRRDVGPHVLHRGVLRSRRRAVRRARACCASSPMPAAPCASCWPTCPRFVSTPEIRVDCPDDLKFDVVARRRQRISAPRTT